MVFSSSIANELMPRTGIVTVVDDEFIHLQPNHENDVDQTRLIKEEKKNCFNDEKNLGEYR